MADEEGDYFSYKTKDLEIEDEDEDDTDDEDDEELFSDKKRKRTDVGTAAAAVSRRPKAAAAGTPGDRKRAGVEGGGRDDDCEVAAEPTGHRVGTRRTRGAAATAPQGAIAISDESDEDDGESSKSGAHADFHKLQAAMAAQVAKHKQLAQEQTVDDSDDEDPSAAPATAAPEAPPVARKKVLLKLQAPGGHEVKMKTFLDAPFQTLFDQYCVKRDLDPATVHFMLDGDKLDMTTTPEDEDMEGGEIIEVSGPGATSTTR